MTEKENKNCLSWKKYDLFSTPFNFTYKKKGKYSTKLGGLITVLYFLGIAAYLIFELVYFVKREKYELVYLEENMDSTDILNFKQSNNDFAYRLEFKNNNNSSLTCEDLLDVKIQFIHSKRNQTTGKRDKERTNITTYNCNIFSKSNESTGTIYKCLDNLNQEIRNVYNDPFFSYYEINVYLRESEKDNFTNINDFLLINDCKIEFYYIDYTIKVENYDNPIIPYQNSVFLQLNPVSILEMNVYFMKQILKERRSIVSPSREKTTENTVFSRVEQYSYYKGEDRVKRKIQNDGDYKNYAKIFIRADTKKLNVQRNYESITGFWADHTQIFFDAFTVSNFFIGMIYNFLQLHSLSKKLFYFYDIDKKEHNNFNYHPNVIKLKELINKMNNDEKLQINKAELNLLKLNPKASMNTMNEMRINQKQISEENSNISYSNLRDSPISTGNDTKKESSLKSKKNCFSKLFLARCNNNYKNYSKANKMIEDKLDIVLYVRNTILLDIISQTVLGKERKNIARFLSIPLVSLKDIKNENKKDNIFEGNTKRYIKYREEDFEECEKEMENLAAKEEKGELDKNFISYIQDQYKELEKLVINDEEK